ncbi:dienelactone hydrolase family-domain-containing protein [Lipomyces oligophaga]|uniref:dienelactone hydrolase family-domain-containing protein n=1 Tax=Lipomyces oligophaga TaxID=45792 RepID=UPI0034CE0B2A
MLALSSDTLVRLFFCLLSTHRNNQLLIQSSVTVKLSFIKMASNPPGICCLTGVKHEGAVSGKIIDFHGVETYITGDVSSKKVILFITDIFGHVFSNAQLIADDFAEQGYLVLVPDILKGDPVPWDYFDKLQDFDLGTWLTKHPKEVTEPIVEAVLAGIKADYSPTSIAAIGYCYGAKYVVRLLGAGKIDAGGIAHPSFVDYEEIEAVTKPLNIQAAETDPIFPVENRIKTEAILTKNKAIYEISVYSGVVHGFAVRGDPKVPQTLYAKERAFFSFAAFFKFHLK